MAGCFYAPPGKDSQRARVTPPPLLDTTLPSIAELLALRAGGAAVLEAAAGVVPVTVFARLLDVAAPVLTPKPACGRLSGLPAVCIDIGKPRTCSRMSFMSAIQLLGSPAPGISLPLPLFVPFRLPTFLLPFLSLHNWQHQPSELIPSACALRSWPARLSQRQTAVKEAQY